MQIVYDASQVDAMPHTDCLDGRHIYILGRSATTPLGQRVYRYTMRLTFEFGA